MATSTVLPAGEWRARRDRHSERVEALIGPYLRARRSGRNHPVLDFLFTYYSSRPSHVRRWHPGFGVVLADGEEYLGFRGYQRVPDGVTASWARLTESAPTVERINALLSATADRPPRLGCFGLHEWAMVYRTERPRHSLPLRLGSAGSDVVVESAELRCTHFDAFRFFTDSARPRNEIQLSRAEQITHEQPGCLHATMDLYRACISLTPLINSSLTFDAFELALDARELDMRASPYDLRELGYEPVAIETAAGRATYVREQAALAERGATVRSAIIEQCRGLSAAVPSPAGR